MTAGIDVVLEQRTDGSYDIQVGPDGDLLTADAFDTAILVSLFTDARADESEIPIPEYRRGWIGNEVTEDFEMGSKLWLFYQNRLNQDTVNSIVDAAQNALQWMLEDSLVVSNTSIADGVSASGSIVNGALVLEITIVRPSSVVEKRYFELWTATGNKGINDAP